MKTMASSDSSRTTALTVALVASLVEDQVLALQHWVYAQTITGSDDAGAAIDRLGRVAELLEEALAVLSVDPAD